MHGGCNMLILIMRVIVMLKRMIDLVNRKCLRLKLVEGYPFRLLCRFWISAEEKSQLWVASTRGWGQMFLLIFFHTLTSIWYIIITRCSGRKFWLNQLSLRARNRSENAHFGVCADRSVDPISVYYACYLHWKPLPENQFVFPWYRHTNRCSGSMFWGN